MGILVSIIIPCYNAEHWVADAIQSCLNQSYHPIEVIVIDDGSTDKSLEVIKSFGDKVRFESVQNRGGNPARNNGFFLSKGEYIQFLDADDVLAPKKIEHQITFLIEDKADAVSGEWRMLNEARKGQFLEGPVENQRQSSDILCSLIDVDGWAPNFSYLIRRSFIEQIGGWQEDLSSMQDVDFSVSLAIHGARFATVQQFCGYYRRPLQLTTSTKNRGQFMNNCFHVYERVEKHFNTTKWTEERRQIIIECYGSLARYYFEHDKSMFNECVKRIRALKPHYVPNGPAILRWLSQVIGYRKAEGVALFYRKAKKRLGVI